MLEIELKNLSLGFGDRTLFSDADLSIYTGDRVGLIGANGCGKTTLLRAIKGPDRPSGVFTAQNLRIGYLEQQLGDTLHGTVLEAASEACSELFAMESELERLGVSMASAAPEELDGIGEKYNRLRTEFERRGGYGVNSRILGVLRGIGLGDEFFRRDTSALSGGEKARLAIARLLLSDYDVLLLDEPTNHLDLRASQWLTDYLCGIKTTVLVVSHDRYLLDRLCGSIAEISAGKMICYKGNYTQFRAKRDEQNRLLSKQYEQQQQEIKRQQEIIKQYRAFNREKSIRAAESREKALARMELVDAPERIETMRLEFAPAPRTGSEVLRCSALSVGFGQKVLLRPTELLLLSGRRVCLVGDNGCGKTTFLRSLLGRQEHGGAVKWGSNAIIGYYDQHHGELDGNNTVLDEIWRGNRKLTQTQVRSAAAAMLFTGEDVFKRVDTLSGGEKARTALCRLAVSGCNILLMDEPTNHLDMASREVLEQALSEFEGTVICVSHDRYFINRIAHEVWELKNGCLSRFEGNYDDYLAAVAPKEEGSQEQQINKTAQAKKRAADRAQREADKAARARRDRLEKDIEELEGIAAGLEELFSGSEIYGDTALLLEKQHQYREVKERLDGLYEQWMELQQE